MELGFFRIFGRSCGNADTKICSPTKWTLAKKTTRSYVSWDFEWKIHHLCWSIVRTIPKTAMGICDLTSNLICWRVFALFCVCTKTPCVFNITSEFSATSSAQQKARTPHQSWLQVLPLPHPESSPPGCQAMVAWWRHHNQPTLSLPPRKLTWHWNKWWIFHCHVSFQGVGIWDNVEFSDGNPELKPMTNSIQQLLVIWGPDHLNKSFRSHVTRFHWQWCFQASHEACPFPLPTHPPNLPWHWI